MVIEAATGSPRSASVTGRSLLDSLPTELLISILQLLHPVDVISFSQTCKHHYHIAIDNDEYWLKTCFDVTRMNTPQLITEDLLREAGSKLLQAVALHTIGAVTNPFFHVYKDHLACFGWFMGFWIATNNNGVSELWDTQIRLDTQHRFMYNCATFSGPNLIIAPPPFFEDQPFFDIDDGRLLVHSFAGELDIGGHNFGVSSNSYHLVGASWATGADGLPSTLRSIEEHGLTRRDPRAGDVEAISTFGSKVTSGNFNDAPYPSPALAPAFLDARANKSPYLPPCPGDTRTITLNHQDSPLPQTWTLLRLRSPDDFPSTPTDLIHPGIYTAPYPGCGPEYVYVNIRTLTEADFDASNWPWDGSLAPAVPPPPPQREGEANPIEWSNPNTHLGPFSNIFRSSWASPIRVWREHVRPGARVIEVIKIVGDVFVPQGARSIFAFLGDPLVSVGKLREAERELPEQVRYDEEECPWPIVPDAVSRGSTLSRRTILQKQYAPSRGIDLPACARVGSLGFKQPEWRDCTVHVESRTQFSAWWHDLQSVAVFTRVRRAFAV